MDDLSKLEQDLVQLARLSVEGRRDDVRLFVARLVRRYRKDNAKLSAQLEAFLQHRTTRNNNPLRRMDETSPMPMDNESRLSLFRQFDSDVLDLIPILSDECRATLEQLVFEREQVDRLVTLGLTPTRSAIFLGNPGVGKTLAARWIASQLNLPLFVLDLTAVMSSYLGKTGANLRIALDYAKETPCVLLLDEIDAIAKKRNDESDVGELKRLVTVMLQEIELWPATGLLLAATNHPELIDRALWRRFDLVVEFDLPDHDMIIESLSRFLESDYERFSSWLEILAVCFQGESFSGIERTIQRFRRAVALEIAKPKELVESYIINRSLELPHKERISLATMLTSQTGFSQRAVSDITGVSRDTIRKYIAVPAKEAR